MEFKDYYKTLGLAKKASADDVKKAFRKLARKYHPDVSKAADANERMAEVNEANDVLSDPERRLAYDTLAAQPTRSGPGGYEPPPNWDAGFEFTDRQGRGAGQGAAYSDFFEQLFGRQGQRTRGAAGDGNPNLNPGDFESMFGGPARAQRGADHHARIELDITDSYTGAEREIVLRSAASSVNGKDAAVTERHLQIKIPKGVFAGQHIRLAGRGSPGLGDAGAGDLLLEVMFRTDPRWRAEGRDVFQRVLLSPWEAALGATATIDTPSGQAEVTLPAGWKTGRKLRLKGRGLPGSSTGSGGGGGGVDAGVGGGGSTGSRTGRDDGGANKAESGNLYLELELALPSADTDAARAAFAALALAFPGFKPRVGQGA